MPFLLDTFFRYFILLRVLGITGKTSDEISLFTSIFAAALRAAVTTAGDATVPLPAPNGGNLWEMQK